MASCSFCNSFILFGGRKDDTGRYCDENCQRGGNLLAFSHQIPEERFEDLLVQTHGGPCPRCSGRGPVDVHKAHKVWSMILMTSWSSSPEMSCKSCAVKRQIGASVFSLILGWWGFPWGILMTPIQIIRNVIEMAGGPSSMHPSPLLEKYVRIQTAAELEALAQSAEDGSSETQ